MKKILSVLIGVMMLVSFASCSRDNSNADKGDDGIIDDAGNAVNDVLDGAENVVDDVTGSDGGNNQEKNNSNNNNMTDNQNNQ